MQIVNNEGIDSAYKVFGEHKFFTEEDIAMIMQTRAINVADTHRKDMTID